MCFRVVKLVFMFDKLYLWFFLFKVNFKNRNVELFVYKNNFWN